MEHTRGCSGKSGTLDGMKKSVMKHYTDEVSSCLFLSSGLDSNLILAILKKNNVEIPTISISFEKSIQDSKISNESQIVKKICTEHKIENHHSLITKDLIKEYDNQFCNERGSEQPAELVAKVLY